MTKTLYAKYFDEISAWDWEDILAWMEESTDMEDNPIRTHYLGSVLALAPSGKYYTPWANSNVDACPFCHGKGHFNLIPGTEYSYPMCNACGGLGSVEAYRDQEYWRALEQIATSHGGYIEQGEGDPLDTYFTVPANSVMQIDEPDIEDDRGNDAILKRLPWRDDEDDPRNPAAFDNPEWNGNPNEY